MGKNSLRRIHSLQPGSGLKLPGGTCCGEAERAAPLRDLLGLQDLRGGVVVFCGESLFHGDEQAPQLRVVPTTAVGLEAEWAQQGALEHNRIGRRTEVFLCCPWLKQKLWISG